MQECLRQLFYIGFLSLPIIALTALFTGAVLVLQSYIGFSRFNAESVIANIVVISITRELGPVIVGLMAAGRVGASLAAEIGSMKVTDQLEALPTLAVDPFNYIMIPRVLAGVIAMPVLVCVADILAVYGGYFVAVYKLDFNPELYLVTTRNFFVWGDFLSGLVKAVVFGAIITFISCFCGYNCEEGAKGVGKATTMAVVLSSIFILIMNYVITEISFHV